ncbi:MAG TPA: hypothetical protein VIL36_13115 [Acidimicrobiales bacterium]
MRLSHRWGRCALVAAVLVLAACNGLTVDQRGVYTTSPTQEITGTVNVGEGDSLTSVTVNGIPAEVDGANWRVDLPLDGAEIFNEVVVEATFGTGQVITERRTVVYGDGEHAQVLPEGQVLDRSVGLRINDSSFSKIGPVIKSLTTIDLGAVAPPGTVLIDECMTQVIVCTLYVKASTARTPTIRDFDVALDSLTGNAQALVNLHDLHLEIDVNARVLGVPTNCDLEIDADRVTIDGRYTLRPDPSDPQYLDVNLVGTAPAVTLTGVSHDFTGGVCSLPLLEQIVNLVLGDIQTLMRDGLIAQLGDPDGSGPADSPVADAIEGALANVHVAGPIGDALGLTLTSQHQDVSIDPAGIGFRASGSFTSSGPAPEAPDLTGSVGWGDDLGAIGSTTPSGANFDVAVGASATSFNQLLAGETERGLLNVDVTEIDGQPLTLKSMLDLIGAGGIVTEDMPLVISLRPEVAPVVTTASPGPGGALGELRMAGYRVTVKSPEPEAVIMELVIDFTTGVDMVSTPDGLGFSFDAPAADAFSTTITQNPLAIPPVLIDQVFHELSPRVFASVQDALPSFPLPQFVGLNLETVEVNRLGTGFVLYANLVPAP